MQCRVLVYLFLAIVGWGTATAAGAQGQDVIVSKEPSPIDTSPESQISGASGGTIRGTVIDASDNQPASGVRVFARHETIPGAASILTAPDGTYELSLTFDGNWFVYAGGPGSAFQQFLVGQLYSMIECVDPGEVCDFTSGDPVALSGGNVVENIDFSMTPGGLISGEYLEATTGYDANDFPEINIYDSAGTLYARLSSFYIVMQYSASGLRRYITDALPAGTYRLGSSSLGMVDQVYPDLDCPNLACDVTQGDLVALPAETELQNITFNVHVDAAQGGAIAGTASDRNVEETFPIARIRAWDPVSDTQVGASASSSRSYILAGVPAASNHRVTASDFGYYGELFDNIRCDDGGSPPCDLAPGTPISTSAGSITDDIDFCLTSSADLLEDGFECGDLAAWSAVVP